MAERLASEADANPPYRERLQSGVRLSAGGGPWQHVWLMVTRGARAKRESREGLPGSSPPTPAPPTQPPVRDHPFWGYLRKAHGLTTVVILGGFWYLASTLSRIETNLAGLEKIMNVRVEAIEKDLEKHRDFHRTGVGSSKERPVASASASVSPPDISLTTR